MNRQMKRMQERAERQSRRGGPDRPTPATTARRAAAQEKRTRTSARQFLREVRAELRKVDWPTRRELVTSTVVVLVTVVVLTTLVAGLDLAFSKVVLNVLGD
jgi:preprotein translocase subunit SecE